MSITQPRIAIIGCGAITRQSHLPALGRLGVVPAVCVDVHEPAAREAAALCGCPRHATGYREALGEFDAALVCLPNHLHADVGVALLAAGKHVLVEKPMACTAADCERMVQAARQHRRVLAVGHMRRFHPVHRWVQQALREGLLGDLRSFDYREGFELTWPFHSDYFFRRDKAGGGVLIDSGAHALDLVQWWFGAGEVAAYRDDNYGGVECDAEVELNLAGGAEGLVELSRSRKLRNTCVIRGARGELEVGVYGQSLRARPHRLLRNTFEGQRGDALAGGGPPVSLYDAQLADWLEAMQQGRAPRVSGEEGARCVQVIEQSYRRRLPLEFPWIKPGGSPAVDPAALARRRVLVTGATGFLAGRLVEQLVLQYGASPRVLLRRFDHASRLARFPVTWVQGAITDEDRVRQAVEGCDYVVHAAHDWHSVEANLRGIEVLADACLRARVARLVYISTVAVYEPLTPGVVDEHREVASVGWSYPDTKRAMENRLLEWSRTRGLPVVILQPTNIYGPFSQPWTVAPMEQMRTGQVVVADHGEGLCNAVYVDDVVTAILRALVADGATGERFLVSAEKPITWAEFYEAYAQVLGVEGIRFVPTSELEARLRRSSRSPSPASAALRPPAQVSLARRIYRVLKARLKPEHVRWLRRRMPLEAYYPDEQSLRLQAARAAVSIDKAKRVLGYQPRFDFREGMARTAEYIRRTTT
jgi:predicted dehydrogenase/nucleoside-diphosphate-sugar epimerase